MRTIICSFITFFLFTFLNSGFARAQVFGGDSEFTKADSIRGSVTAERAWWDVIHYGLEVEVYPEDSTLSGVNHITYRITDQPQRMQIDLQQPLRITSVIQNGKELNYERQGNAYFVDVPNEPNHGAIKTISVYYDGKPKVAERAPWDGGMVWKKDKNGTDWIAVACQGLGASVWWPNKDHLYDEPDSATISVTVPEHLTAVSNGQFREERVLPGKRQKVYTWFVSNPINNYNISITVGDLVYFSDVFDGEDGRLDLDYWVLSYNLDKAKEQFKQTKTMLKAFEYWFGPYPFYEDSFMLVETPYLGMEHQSGIAYGNKYQNGYLGRDLSGTGLGLNWDFILIHEAGHEWFGNNISMRDVADMWIHESFTHYSENLYVEYINDFDHYGEYVIGTRRSIANDIPIIGKYDVNNEGSGDMYYKGASMIHAIRTIINNDDTFRSILRGMNQHFRHRTVTTEHIESYINHESGFDFSKVFDQYLRTVKVPNLNYARKDGKLMVRWSNVVDGFDMPVRVKTDKDGSEYEFIYPVEDSWTVTNVIFPKGAELLVDPNFYVEYE